MEVSQEVSSMVRGWLRASPASSKRKPPPTYVPILPRPGRLGLGAEAHKESADAVRSLAVAVRMERKIVGRRRKKADTARIVDAKYVRTADGQSQDLCASSDEECSRTVAVGIPGMKMGGTRSQELLLGGCKGLQRRKRKRRKRQKQEVAVSKATVSKATVSKATVSGTIENDPNQLDISVKITAEDNRLEDSKEPSPSTAINFDRRLEEKQVLPEVLSTEATRSKHDSKQPRKRPKSALHSTRRASLKKTRQRDGPSSRESDTEESPIATQAAKRTQYEKSTPSELDMLKLSPICEQSNTEATSSKDLSTSTQFPRNIKRRLKNARNSEKLQTDVFTDPNPALDKASWLQAMRDVDMETGVLSQRRVIHGSRAKRQLQRKAFLHQKRKLMRKRIIA